jgi:hypothetical protein
MATIARCRDTCPKHTWAIDNTFNCRVPSKVYTVQLDTDQHIITWRDALSNTDVARIDTRTVTSIVMFSAFTVHRFIAAKATRLERNGSTSTSMTKW